MYLYVYIYAIEKKKEKKGEGGEAEDHGQEGIGRNAKLQSVRSYLE